MLYLLPGTNSVSCSTEAILGIRSVNPISRTWQKSYCTVLQRVQISFWRFCPLFLSIFNHLITVFYFFLTSTFIQYTSIAIIMYITVFSPCIQTGYCVLHWKGLGQEVGISAPSSTLYHLSDINLSHRPYPNIETDGHRLSWFPRTTLFVHGSNPKKNCIKTF